MYSRIKGGEFTIFTEEEQNLIIEKINSDCLPNTGWVCLNIKTDQRNVAKSALIKREDNSKFLNVDFHGHFPVVSLFNEGRMIGKAAEFPTPDVIHIGPKKVVEAGQFTEEVNTPVAKQEVTKLPEVKVIIETPPTEEPGFIGESVVEMISKMDDVVVTAKKEDVVEEEKETPVLTTLTSLPTKMKGNKKKR